MSTSKKKNAPQPKPENIRLALRAETALKDDKFERRKNLCQRFVRQCIQDIYGSKYDAFHKGSAVDSMEAWKDSPYAVAPQRGSVVGDILYKKATKSVPDGHVGIRIPGNRVAENSSVHSNGKHGAKGVRRLEDFGPVSLIVRLPLTK